MLLSRGKVMMVAVITVTATIVISCGNKIRGTDALVGSGTPVQTVDSIYATKTENGRLVFRMTSTRMEKYEISETESYDEFSDGFYVYGYNDDGLLETEIVSVKARHTTFGKDKNEKWSAYGDVVIRNFLKGERIETDTLYWDQKSKKIWTDCYVRLVSPQGLMQGFGMESDEMARNAELLRPFNSYGIVDSTKVQYLDTANFIGPMMK